MCYMMDMHIFEREMGGRRYRVAAQSVWDSARARSVARQAVLGPADAAPTADLGETRAVGTRAVGDVGALLWVAEQLDLVGHIDRACVGHGAKNGPSVGEMVLGVALQRACDPGPKRDLAEFLYSSVPRVSCLPGSMFTGQAFRRIAQRLALPRGGSAHNQVRVPQGLFPVVGAHDAEGRKKLAGYMIRAKM